MYGTYDNLKMLLRLGDPRLHYVSAQVDAEEILQNQAKIELLHKIILEFRARYGMGRAVAAPQIGWFKRIICWNTGTPVTLINPELSAMSDERMEVWDDCMCFPGLVVKVHRHFSCTLRFQNEELEWRQWQLEGSESELIQHEMDHLDGILATQRAVDDRSFKLIHSLTPEAS